MSRLSQGGLLASCLSENLRLIQYGPENIETGSIITGITADGRLSDGMDLPSFHHQMLTILAESRRVFWIENSLFLQQQKHGGNCLRLLLDDVELEASAPQMLSGIVMGGNYTSEEQITTFLLPSKLINSALQSTLAQQRIPRLREYSRTPLFGPDFHYYGPGYHPEQGYLVHGPRITPTEYQPRQQGGILERVPPSLARVLGEFCWAESADLVNFLALLLTGVLKNHFVDYPHPLALFNGNQPGLGKTLLCEIYGLILEGQTPRGITLGDDTELEKQIGASISMPEASVLLFDNVRGRIKSQILEKNSLAPCVQVRRLGQSSFITRKNDLIWLITGNNILTTPDLVSRSLLINLRYDGNPQQRDFVLDIHQFVRQNRNEILAELYGMVQFWRQSGGAPGRQKHRCGRWAETLGGILDATGMGSYFMSNHSQAESEMNEDLSQFAGLVEHLLDRGNNQFMHDDQSPGSGKTAAEWVGVLNESGVLEPSGGAANRRSLSTKAGAFLARVVARPVPVDNSRFHGRAVLRLTRGRSNQKLYEIALLAGSETSPAESNAFACLPPSETPAAVDPAPNTPADGDGPTPGIPADWDGPTPGIPADGDGPRADDASSGPNDLDW
ncbi:MAG: hypothetical protein ACKO23_12630 [Gemmataceae bacterium]